jgi:hypothetical protein
MRALSRSRLFCAILAPLAVAAICLPTGGVERVAGLTGKDVIQVRQAIRKELWHQALPSWSVYSLRYLTGRVFSVCRAKIEVVGPQPDGHVQVNVTFPGHYATLYGLIKQSNRWVIDGTPLNIGW